MTNAEEMFAHYHRDVLPFLSHMTGRSDVAEDLAQDVFVRIVCALHLPKRTAEISIAYDLWLVQQTANGAKTVRHLALNGRQGGKMPFKFDPLSLPLDISARTDAESPLKMYVDGTITGRATPGGTIQVSLHKSRCKRGDPSGL